MWGKTMVIGKFYANTLLGIYLLNYKYLKMVMELWVDSSHYKERTLSTEL